MVNNTSSMIFRILRWSLFFKERTPYVKGLVHKLVYFCEAYLFKFDHLRQGGDKIQNTSNLCSHQNYLVRHSIIALRPEHVAAY